MKVLLLLAFVTLTGCAAEVISSSERSVVVRSHTADAPGAQKLADAECAKRNRFARMSARPDYTSNDFVFDCVN